MMRVLLDEVPCSADARSVGEAIDQAAISVSRAGRVITEVIVNGTALTVEELSSADLRERGANTVELVTADLRELVVRTLSDASAALGEANDLQRTAAQHLERDEAGSAMAHLNEALEIWMSVHEAVIRSAEAVAFDFDSLAVGKGTMNDAIRRLSEQLRELRNALADSDHVRVSDALQYDLPDIVLEWRDALSAMRERIEAEG